MRKAFICLLLSMLAVLMAGRSFAAPNDFLTNGWGGRQAELAQSSQLLLVTTKDWDTVPGQMRRFFRGNPREYGATWTEVGKAIPIVVGRNGLGWGRGLPLPVALAGPVKKEGDGKSPAGIFRLSSAFGFATAEQMKNIKLPYRQLTDGIECVDDVKSGRYNSIVDRGAISQPDWNSSEKMRQVTVQYRLGIVVDHNVNPMVPAGGSCIFMHIWLSDTTGTSGCTAMAPEQMESLLGWLDAAKHPVLMQMPEKEFEATRKYLLLPKL